MLRVMGEHGSHTAEPKAFAVQAGDVLLEVRIAVGQMLEACGVPLQTVQRSHRQLGIDKMLAWRLSKVLQSDDPFATARHMPGAAAMRALFERAEAEAVAPEVIVRAEKSIERLEAFIHEHAQSRRAFDLMLSAHADQGVEEADLVHRKEATAALSYIWGVLARAHLRTYVCRPGASDMIDVAGIGGFIDLQWIKPNVGWLVSQRARYDDDDPARALPFGELGEHRPLDPGVQPGDVPLLRKYCSEPLPPMRRIEAGSGRVIDEIIQSNVGRSSATTCLIGEINYAWMPRYLSQGVDGSTYSVFSRTPAETFIFDYLIHRDMVTPSEPKLQVYGDLELRSETAPASLRSRHRLMPWKELENLGWGIKRAYTPHFARYVELLGDCFEALGWDSSEFLLHRAVIEHPVIPSTLSIWYELFPKP